jgi:acyl carrier protein
MSENGLSPERIHKRLGRIFVKAFPEVNPAEISAASTDTVPGWDSIATLTLFMLCEEDFDIKIGYDRIAETKTYDDFFELVKNAVE